MFDLIVQSGKLQGRRLSLPVDKAIVIGRDDGCQLVLTSSLISRRHTELCHRLDGIEVRDLGSQNGTYVNEVAISEPTLLKVGDVLRIGACLFEVQKQQTMAGIPQQAVAPSKSTVAKPQIPSRPGAGHSASNISDNEIADWLSDGDSAIDLPGTGSDTTIIRGRDVPSSPAIPATTPAPATPRPAVTPKKFRSVKEEAADIIRRHWAKVRGETAATD